MKKTSFAIFAFTILLTPLVTFGQGYEPLVGVPGVSATASDFNTYINSLYVLSISIAALLAVIKIIIAGVKWMLTDIVTSKGEAKKDIEGAIIGLLIVLAAVLVLTVINPNLVKVNLTLQKLGTTTMATTTATAPTLDASTIKSFSVPGTLTSVSYSASTDPAQQQLFNKSCTGTSHYLLNVARCVKAGSGEAVTVQTSCTQLDCSVPCKNDVNFKGHIVDPQVKSLGYCVLKK